MREPQWSINSAVMAKRKRSAIVKDLDFLVSSSNSALISTKHLSQNRDSEDEVSTWQSLDRDVTDEDTAQRKRRRPDPSESVELASKIGMSAFVLLAQACKFVPQSFPARQALITNIARAGFKYMQLPVLSAEEISTAIQTSTWKANLGRTTLGYFSMLLQTTFCGKQPKTLGCHICALWDLHCHLVSIVILPFERTTHPFRLYSTLMMVQFRPPK